MHEDCLANLCRLDWVTYGLFLCGKAKGLDHKFGLFYLPTLAYFTLQPGTNHQEQLACNDVHAHHGRNHLAVLHQVTSICAGVSDGLAR